VTRQQALRNGLSLAALVISLDQLSKWWITDFIMQPPRIIPVTPFFNLVLGYNRGVSFGIFDSHFPFNQWLLSLVALAITAALVIWLARADKPWLVVTLGLIIGGAIGNVIDRLVDGAVIDFLDFHWGTHHWPAFNVADTGITMGAAALILDSLFVRGGKC